MLFAKHIGVCLCMSLGLLSACGDTAPNDVAAAVSDRFVDLYVVEVDQQQALAMTTGVAKQRIVDELAQVGPLRAAGYTAAQAKPRVYYKRTMFRRDEASGRARAVYDLRIESHGSPTRRHVLVSLTGRDGNWKVANFVLRDGAAAQP